MIGASSLRTILSIALDQYPVCIGAALGRGIRLYGFSLGGVKELGLTLPGCGSSSILVLEGARNYPNSARSLLDPTGTYPSTRGHP